MKTSKTITAIACMVLMASGLQAQYADMYYHRVGDTIEWRPNNGYFAWWEFEYFYQNNIGITANSLSWWFFPEGAYDSVIILQRLYTPVPLKIIGIAGSPFVYDQSIIHLYSLDESSGLQDYFYVYDATPTGLVRLAETPWSLFDPHRTVHIKNHIPSTYGAPGIEPDSCCCYHPTQEWFPVFEYYFDSAFYVTDSFYVGGSLNNPPSSQRKHAGYRMAYNPGSEGSCSPEQVHSDCDIVGMGTVMKVKYAWGATDWSKWMWGSRTIFPGIYPPAIIYPIIEVDTTVPPEGSCIQVANLEVPVVDSGCAVVTWDDFPNYTGIVLQYGPLVLPPSQWTTIEIGDSSFYRICGFNEVGRYGVRVKAICDKVETEWTAPVYFYSAGYHDDTTTAVPTILSANTFLSPNPASGQVVVSSSFDMINIDIYTAQGILVYSAHPNNHRQEISLDGLHAGTYLVVIDTYAGTTHKKLVIN